MQPGDPPTKPLRFRLFLLAASGLVPLALVILGATAYIAQQREAATQRSALELSRALAITVDAELQSTIALLQNVAAATQLEALDVSALDGGGFAPAARRLTSQQGWRNMLVTDASGRNVMRAVDAPIADNGAPVEPRSLAQVLQLKQPAVGRVARGPLGNDAYAVRVPVLSGGELRYILTAVVPTERVLTVVARQRLAPAWVVGVFDQDGFRVARSKNTQSPRFSPTLERLVQTGGQEGMGRTHTLEGVPSLTGFSRVPTSQWVVAVGIPVAEANADFYRLATAVGGGMLASLALLAWLAWRTARGISAPMEQLTRAATDLGAGRPVSLQPLGVEELDAVGRALRQAATDRDLAAERRARVKEEREQLLARLEQALREAEEANRSKDEFLALLGHELRNPLAPITNAVQLMQMKGDASTANERGIIQRQLKYVTRLVDDLLDASRITSRRLEINPKPLRPVAVLEQTLESLMPMLGGRRLGFHADAAARLQWVSADEARLVQVFNNLLGNAVKFTRDDGMLDVRVIARGDAVEIVFRDDGAGMTPEALAHAFDLFYQAPGHARGVNGGLGLGLAIVKTLVELHSGSVRAQSDGPGRGTAITLSFPVCDPPVTEAPPAAPAPPDNATRILVVDDNVDAADTLAMLLEVSGYRTRVVYDPQAALAAMPEFRPDMAILDIGLPGMTGYELAQALRGGAPPFSGVLIAVTGYGQQQDVKNAMDAGFDAHLTKPVAPHELLALIARLLAGEARR
jgi:signal transduction histidine kinase/ActR/RegA family two-component response regulator